MVLPANISLILLVLTAILFIAVIVISIYTITLRAKLRKLFAGGNAKSLENLMIEIMEDLKKVHKYESEISAHLGHVEKRLQRSIQGFDLKRFNPFADSGSNQSFAVSLVNEEGDGIVISSLYARDRHSIFAKPISQLKSIYDLTDEEKEVLKNAHEKLSHLEKTNK